MSGPRRAVIASIHTIYDGWCRLLKASLELGGRRFDRHVEDHGKAVAILPYDASRKTALLVRQPRAAMLYVGQPDILEAIAGRVEDEHPEACARREALEEAGVALGELEHVARVWTMPSLSTELIDYYLAAYSASDRVSDGGGALEEDEHIEVVEARLADLWSAATALSAIDGKALILLQALRIRRPDLFS